MADVEHEKETSVGASVDVGAVTSVAAPYVKDAAAPGKPNVTQAACAATSVKPV